MVSSLTVQCFVDPSIHRADFVTPYFLFCFHRNTVSCMHGHHPFLTIRQYIVSTDQKTHIQVVPGELLPTTLSCHRGPGFVTAALVQPTLCCFDRSDQSDISHQPDSGTCSSQRSLVWSILLPVPGCAAATKAYSPWTKKF